MSGMWVAVTAEYDGATFSHRAQSFTGAVAKSRGLSVYYRVLDEAATAVDNGLRNWLPKQDERLPDKSSLPLSSHEKLRAIEKIVTHQSEARTPELDRIRQVLDR